MAVLIYLTYLLLMTITMAIGSDRCPFLHDSNNTTNYTFVSNRRTVLHNDGFYHLFIFFYLIIIKYPIYQSVPMTIQALELNNIIHLWINQ